MPHEPLNQVQDAVYIYIFATQLVGLFVYLWIIWLSHTFNQHIYYKCIYIHMYMFCDHIGCIYLIKIAVKSVILRDIISI